MSLTITVLGWLGAASLLLAYGMTSTGKLAPEGARFQLLNLAGAVALTVNSAYHGAWPSAALNVVWIIIGLAALVRARRRRMQPTADLAPPPNSSQPNSSQPSSSRPSSPQPISPPLIKGPGRQG